MLNADSRQLLITLDQIPAQGIWSNVIGLTALNQDHLPMSLIP